MHSDVIAEPAAPQPLSHAETLYDFLAFARRQFYPIAFIAVLTIALGVIYSATARPSYTAQAELMIDARKLQVFQQQSILGDIPIDTAQVESQVEVLKSENVALSVIKNLHLTEDPEFTRPDGGLLGTLIDFIFSPFGSSEHTASEFEVTRSAVRAFQDRLSIKRIGLTYIIQISFRSYNAEHAAEIANAVADAYIVDQLEAKYQATRRASAWLQDRIKELRDQVSTAERAVVDFKTKNEIVSTGGPDKRLLGEQQVVELSSQLVIARANTAEARARLDRIESVLKTDSPSTSIGATVTDTLKNEVVSKLRSQYLDLAAKEADWTVKYGHDHLAVVNVRNQMREIQNAIFQELRRLGETYKSDYAIAKQREAGVRAELAQAVAQSQSTDEKSVTLRELQSTAQTYKSLYDNFLQRYMEAVQQQSFPITEARLISTATRPLGKSHPRTRFILMVAGLGGIMLGFGIGVLRDLSDRVFRTSKQVETLLHAECIGFVPLVKAGQLDELSNNPAEEPSKSSTISAGNSGGFVAVANSAFARLAGIVGSIGSASDPRGRVKATRPEAGSKASNGSGVGALPPDVAKLSKALGPRIIVRGDAPEFRAVVEAPFSRFVETIRSIKLAADLNGNTNAGRVIGFTSSLPNEGKSTIAVALAQLTAQVGARTILVDCDLRNPSISRHLAPTAKTGLLDIIAGKTTLEEVTWADPITKMAFLPTVIKSRLANSSEHFSSAAIKTLFEKLRERYDYIIVDFSPIAPIIDVRATTHLVDSFVFVIEWGRTKIDVVEHALDKAPGIYENLLGVVLNKVDMDKFGRYATHHEDYYYNKHYARYGYTE